MSYSVEGKSVIVTGAAHGVGLAIARRFVDAGAHVMLAGRDEDQLRKEAALLSSDDGEASYFAGDFSEKLCVANLVAATIDAHDRVDILINASRNVLPSDPFDPNDTAFEALMRTNVATTLRLSQSVAARMIQQSSGEENDEASGAIVNVTSIAARRTLPELMAYSVVSAALDQLTRSLAVAYAQKKIRVNAIALGSVMSTSLKEALKDDGNLHDELKAVTPLGRIGEATEAAEVALFLASEAASFVTGQILAVDGGRTMLDPLDTPAH